MEADGPGLSGLPEGGATTAPERSWTRSPAARRSPTGCRRSRDLERVLRRGREARRVLLREAAAGRELDEAVRALGDRRRGARARRSRHAERPTPSDLVLRALERRRARGVRLGRGRVGERDRARRRRRERQDAGRHIRSRGLRRHRVERRRQGVLLHEAARDSARRIADAQVRQRAVVPPRARRARQLRRRGVRSRRRPELDRSADVVRRDKRDAAKHRTSAGC